jgi:heme-degrading monooxygenase HmoA
MHLHNAAEGRDEELGEYFRSVHVPALDRLRGFMGVQRFRITEEQLMAEAAQPWLYATKYDFKLETPEIDLPALAPLIADMRDAGLIANDGAERIHSYRMYHPWKYSDNIQPGKPLTHLMFLLANITPGRDEEYHRWYDEQHSVEVSESEGYIGMQRGTLTATQVPPVHYCPGSELILGAVQTDNIKFVVQDFIDRAYGRSPSGVAWGERSTAASIARTVHMSESIDGPYPSTFVPTR